MEKLKILNIRLPHELWHHLRTKAAIEETSMQQIVLASIEKIKRKDDKKSLTDD